MIRLIRFTILPTFLFLTIACDDEEFLDLPFESYRYELFKKLIDNSYQFDLVGTQEDIGTYADYKGQPFDRDHEGIGGIETSGVLDNLGEVLANVKTPDIVLLGIGGNDLLNGVESASEPIDNIVEIIEVLRESNPEVIIFLEQIAPGRSDLMTSELTTLFNGFNDLILTTAADLTTECSQIISIDMNTGFTDDLFADDVHYNELGALFVASNYFGAIQAEFDTTEELTILTLGDSRVEGNRP